MEALMRFFLILFFCSFSFLVKPQLLESIESFATLNSQEKNEKLSCNIKNENLKILVKNRLQQLGLMILLKKLERNFLEVKKNTPNKLYSFNQNPIPQHIDLQKIHAIEVFRQKSSSEELDLNRYSEEVLRHVYDHTDLSHEFVLLANFLRIKKITLENIRVKSKDYVIKDIFMKGFTIELFENGIGLNIYGYGIAASENENGLSFKSKQESIFALEKIHVSEVDRDLFLIDKKLKNYSKKFKERYRLIQDPISGIFYPPGKPFFDYSRQDTILNSTGTSFNEANIVKDMLYYNNSGTDSYTRLEKSQIIKMKMVNSGTGGRTVLNNRNEIHSALIRSSATMGDVWVDGLFGDSILDIRTGDSIIALNIKYPFIILSNDYSFLYSENSQSKVFLVCKTGGYSSYKESIYHSLAYEKLSASNFQRYDREDFYKNHSRRRFSQYSEKGEGHREKDFINFMDPFLTKEKVYSIELKKIDTNVAFISHQPGKGFIKLSGKVNILIAPSYSNVAELDYKVWYRY